MTAMAIIQWASVRARSRRSSEQAQMNDVSPIRKNPEYVANCPECRGKHWLIRLDNVNDDWQNIVGTECAGCGFFVDWVLAKKASDG